MLEEFQSIITTEELAKLLRLNEKTIIKLVKEGKLPAMKIANQFRFSKEKIIDWLETQMGSYSDKLLADMGKGESNIPPMINHIIYPSHIEMNLQSTYKQNVLTELVNLADKTGYVVNRDELLRFMIIREKQFTTAVGNGVAFPHPRTSNLNLVNHTTIVIGISKNGIDYNAFDRKPVQIFILLAVPSVPKHLQVLSHLTRIFIDENVRKKVISAASPQEVISLIKEKEQSINYYNN